MSSTEWFFALFGVAFVLIPLGMDALGYAVPRPLAITSVIVGAACFVAAFAVPAYNRWLAPPTYVYYVPALGLAATSSDHNVNKRLLVLRQSGGNILFNTRATIVENPDGASKTFELGEIDPSDSKHPVPPKYFWWTPKTPWNEDYTITFETRDTNFEERIRQEDTNVAIRVRRLDNYADLLDCTDGVSGSPSCPGRSNCSDIVPSDPYYAAKGGFSPQPYSIMPDGGAKGRVTLDIVGMPPTPAIGNPETSSDVRRLTEWQRERLNPALKSYPDRNALILFSGGPNTQHYAEEFRDLFKASRWKVRLIPSPFKANIDVHLLTWKGDFGHERPQVMTLQDAFISAGVKGADHHTCALEMSNVIVLLVGVKSPTDEQTPGVTEQQVKIIDKIIRQNFSKAP